ncbi:MAG: FAD-dependent monooxygenase [Planctomycetales bacterium]|nr:FAD-dependent monooxygenase [Planctomycetales bacterium]
MTISEIQHDELWDVIVIGAGVAGAFAAQQVAFGSNLRVLLIDAKKFPRAKACGCCLNQRGLRVLDRAGLLSSVLELGGQRIQEIEFVVDGKRYGWSVPYMLSTSRARLDAHLVDLAQRAGVVFHDNTRGTVRPIQASDRTQELRRLELTQPGHATRTVSAKIVVVADGLTQSSLSQLPDFETRTEPMSRVGVQTSLPQHFVPGLRKSKLVMTIDKQAYIGMATVEAGQVDIAAAIEPRLLAHGVRPWQIVSQILTRNGQGFACEWEQFDWLATPHLTRRSTKCSDYRLIVIGDSLGYAEPFTGEGMSWALRTAELAVPIVRQASVWSAGIEEFWEREIRQKVVKKQWISRQLMQLVRHPRWTHCAARVCQQVPAIQRWAMECVTRG